MSRFSREGGTTRGPHDWDVGKSLDHWWMLEAGGECNQSESLWQAS